MTSKNKIYTIFGAFVGITASLVVFSVLPLLVEIKTNSEELILKKKSIAVLGIQANEIENFKKNYSLYDPNLLTQKTQWIL